MNANAEYMREEQERQRRYEENRVRYDEWTARYAEEGVDTNWAQAKRQELDTMIEELGVQSKVSEIECRSSLCRLRFFAGESAVEEVKVIAQVAVAAGQERAYRREESEDTAAWVLYLQRAAVSGHEPVSGSSP